MHAARPSANPPAHTKRPTVCMSRIILRPPLVLVLCALILSPFTGRTRDHRLTDQGRTKNQRLKTKNQTVRGSTLAVENPHLILAVACAGDFRRGDGLLNARYLRRRQLYVQGAERFR